MNEIMEVKTWLQAGVFGIFAVTLLGIVKMAFDVYKEQNKGNNKEVTTRILEKLTDGMMDIKSDTQWTREKVNGQHVTLDDIRTNIQGIDKEMSLQGGTLSAIHRRIDTIK